MNRQQFFQTCGMSCLGFSMIALGAGGCASIHSVTGSVEGKSISFPKQAFINPTKSGKMVFRKVIVVDAPNLKFPIAVYRLNDNEYTALWLKCSHQGNQVSVYGDLLSCSAHGSEYDTEGKVVKGPAKEALIRFDVRSSPSILYIDLI